MYRNISDTILLLYHYIIHISTYYQIQYDKGVEYIMYTEYFSQRLAQLRIQKGISARDMSLSIGQNPGYINAIENGKALPTMTNFFYICDFLEISPCDFFNVAATNPKKINDLIFQIQKLNTKDLDLISSLVERLINQY